MHPPLTTRLSRPSKPARAWASFLAFGLVALIDLAAAGAARAQTTFYWGGGSGNWDTTTTDWQTAATGGTATAFTSSPTSIARVGDLGAAGTLTLTVPINAQELDLDNTTGYTIAGTSALTLANGNITTNFISGTTTASITTVISAPLAGTNLNVAATGVSSGTDNDTVTLSAAAASPNTFTGNLNLGAGATSSAATGVAGINRVNITTAAALPTTAAVRFLNPNGAFAVTGGTLALSNAFVLNPNAATGTFVSFIGATSGNGLTLNGTISGVGSVTYAAGINGGAGVVLLNGANSYTGASTLANSTNGVVRLGVSNALPATALVFGDGSTNAAGTTGTSFGALDLNGNNQTVASLATNLAAVGGAVTTAGTATGIINTGAAASTLTINGSAATTYTSTIGVPTNGSTLTGTTSNLALTLAATNTGVLTLTGANSYANGTTISGGKLRLANATGSSATGTGPVVLNGGTATTLSGSGFSTGLLTVTAGSRLAPGVNTGGANGNFGVAGTLTVGSAGGMTLTNANLDFDLANTAATAGGGVNDLLTTGGTLTLGTLGLTINELNGTLLTGTPYTLINGATAETGTPAVKTTYVGGTNYTATYSVNGSNLLVTFATVPEPSTWAAVCLGLGLLGLAHRHRRARENEAGYR